MHPPKQPYRDNRAIEYDAIVWVSCTQQLSDLFECVQYRTSKIIAGAIHWTRKVLHNELTTDSLE